MSAYDDFQETISHSQSGLTLKKSACARPIFFQRLCLKTFGGKSQNSTIFAKLAILSLSPPPCYSLDQPTQPLDHLKSKIITSLKVRLETNTTSR